MTHITLSKIVAIPLLAALMFTGTALIPPNAPVPQALQVEEAEATVRCGDVVKAALRYRYPIAASAVAALVGGACAGHAWTRTRWWNANFDRHLNRCWPNCSAWDFTKMIFGIP